MADRTLTVRIIGDDQSLQRAFARSGRSAQGFNAQVTGIGASMTRVFGAAGVALGASAIVASLSRAVDAASDLEEQIAKNEAVFGTAAAEMEDWSRSAASSMGIAQREALAATGTFGNLFRVIGIAPSQMGDMSRALVQLAADLASFNNASPEEVLVAIRSGLIGEAEPLRRYGVLLSEARVQQIALANSGKSTVKALTDQEKALARYEIIMQDTVTAQGDFERTSDGMANQSRILRAELNNLSTTIGSVLLPSITSLVKGLNFGVGGLDDLADAVGNLGSGPIEAANLSFAELVDRMAEIQSFGSLAGEGGWATEMEDLAQRVATVGAELNRVGASPRLIAAFRQASTAINQALQDGVITPVEVAQLETEELGRLFLTLVPPNVLQGLGANVRSGLEDATATARLGVQDLGAEIRSGIEDMSRAAVVAARDAGEATGDAYADGLRAASGRIQNQLSGLGEQVLRAQIEGDRSGELAALEAQEAKLRRQLELQERIVAQGGVGAPTARRKIRQDILPDLASVVAQQERIRSEIAREQESALDKRTSDTKRLTQKTKVVNQSEKELESERRRADQFQKLGLTREGLQRVPGVGALRRRLGSLREQVAGTVLDTPKTQSQLDRIAAVLKGKFPKVGRDVRQAILEMFNQISGALQGGGTGGGSNLDGEITPGGIRPLARLTAGLGLTQQQIAEMERRQNRRRLGRPVNAFGVDFDGGPSTRGTGGFDKRTGGTPEFNFNIFLDGQQLTGVVVKRVQKSGRRRSARRAGSAAGRGAVL